MISYNKQIPRQKVYKLYIICLQFNSRKILLEFILIILTLSSVTFILSLDSIYVFIIIQLLNLNMKKHNTKQLNARIQKWREMLASDIFSDKYLLKRRVRKGIPPGIRTKVWPRLIHLQEFKNKSKFDYEQLIKRQSISVYDICLDVPRTFPQQKIDILRKSLFNVLKALSLVYPQLGYCQGMNFLTMRLLELLDDEPTFWIMHYILNKHDQLLWNYKSPGSVQLQNFAFVQLLNEQFEKVKITLQQQYIYPPLYTTSWFITLFSKSFEKELFFRFFECFLLEGYQMVYKTALAIMKYKSQRIVQQNMEQNLIYLSDMKFFQNINPDQFMNTVFQLNIKQEDINKYELKYKEDNKKLILRMQEQVLKSYQKKLQQSSKYETVQDQNVQQMILEKSEFKKGQFEFKNWTTN